MKRIIACVLVLVLAVALLTACGGSDANAIVGKWVPSEFEIAGQKMDLAAMAALAGQDMYLEFKADGTSVLNIFGDMDEAPYSFDGTTITMDTGANDVAKYENGKVVMEEDGMKIIFNKK